MERTEEMDEARDRDLTEREEDVPDEMPIDLNMLFSGEKRDLNRLFPEARFRRFLRDVRRNKQGVERFLKRLESDG